MAPAANHSRELTQADLDRIVQEGRDQHFRKYLAETDQTMTDALARKYGHVVPPSRLEAVLAMPSQFEEREPFDKSLASTGDKPSEGGRTLGYSRFDAEPAHVAMDHLKIPKTIAHERLHQLSDPKAREKLGAALYEGMTEDMAIDAIGSDLPKGVDECYRAERAVAREMRELAGHKAVEQAYFAGDTMELRRRLDQKLGPGGMEKLQRQIADLVGDS